MIWRALAAAWSRRWWRNRWEAVIVGEWSGNVYPLTFVRFQRWAEGAAWVAHMNNQRPGVLHINTHYELRPIE